LNLVFGFGVIAKFNQRLRFFAHQKYFFKEIRIKNPWLLMTGLKISSSWGFLLLKIISLKNTD